MKKLQKKISSFFGENLDIILSDMAANTTGNKSLDCIRTNELCAQVIEFFFQKFKTKWSFGLKIIYGRGFYRGQKISKIYV